MKKIKKSQIQAAGDVYAAGKSEIGLLRARGKFFNILAKTPKGYLIELPALTK